MSAFSVNTAVGLAAASFAVNLLNKSDALNNLVNWITGARVNRETLAQGVWHAAIGLLRESPLVTKSLGERGATLAPLLSTALITGNREEMRDAIAELTRIGVEGVLGAGAQGAKGALSTILGSVASTVSTGLVDSYLGAHAGEKVLATMVARHGWAPIEERLRHAMGARVGSGFLIEQIKGVLDAAVIQKTGMNQEASPEYHALADLAHIGLTGGGQDAMIARLKDYAPTSFAAMRLASEGWHMAQSTAKHIATRIDQARTSADDTVRLVKDTVPALLHAIQIKTGIGLQPQPLDDAYATNAHAAHAGEVNDVGVTSFPTNVKDQHVADAYLMQLAVARSARPSASAPAPAPADIPRMAQARVTQGLIDIAHEAPERFEETQQLLDTLSPRQIAPLGERGDIAVVKTLTGQLTRIEASSHRWLTDDKALNDRIEAALARQPGDFALLGGYTVDQAFATQFQTLPFSLPADEYSYADGAWDGGVAAMNAGWGMLGFKTDGLSTHDTARLRQLYNTCGRDEDVMREVTRYLNPAYATALLSSTVLSRYAMPDRMPPTIDIGDGVVRLETQAPTLHFAVTRNANGVTVSVEARWPIVAFGERPDAMRTPIGHKNGSAMTTGYAVTVGRLPDERGIKTQHIAMGTAMSIANTIDFDAGSGNRVPNR